MQSFRKTQISDFAEDVREGLSSTPKFLSSKYFYDEAGSRLFQKIMELPEYYLTRVEFEIFSTQAKEIFEAFTENSKEFDLVELGAGDGRKTAVLIEYFLGEKANFAYAPIDISPEAVGSLTNDFQKKFPGLKLKPRVGDYFGILETLKGESSQPKILLFLGSNIGNFSRRQANVFFNRLRAAMNERDLLFVGFDLQKDPRVVLAAYDDAQGITAKFNLNLLRRINRELGADFALSKFSHYALYHPVEGAAHSFLVSREEQTVFIKELNQSFHFRQWEPIFMEISQKYSPEMIEETARENGFEIKRKFFDSRRYFVDSLWKPF
jgi:probable methyltransferase